MTVRDKQTGIIYQRATWFGFNHWIRAWVEAGPKSGYLHWHASEVNILEP